MNYPSPHPCDVITVELEIPRHIYEALGQFLELRPEWNQHSAGTAALSLFLLQNGLGDRGVAKTYLDAVLLQRKNLDFEVEQLTAEEYNEVRTDLEGF